MKTRTTLLVLALVGAGSLAGFSLKTVLADGIPTTNPLYYSGTLTENGQVVNAARALTVNLWLNPAPTLGETALCVTSVASTPVINGRFRIALDSSCKAKLNANPDVYVEVLDGAASLGRSKIGAVPYAVEADHAVSATTASTATSATNAVYAGDAGHSSTADNATNAGSATSAQSATTATTVTGSLSVGMFRVSASCTTNVNIEDCSCATGEIAVSGGGFCSPGDLIESANVLVTAGGRNLSAWRIQCSSAPPSNYYALCLKAQ